MFLQETSAMWRGGKRERMGIHGGCLKALLGSCIQNVPVGLCQETQPFWLSKLFNGIFVQPPGSAPSLLFSPAIPPHQPQLPSLPRATPFRAFSATEIPAGGAGTTSCCWNKLWGTVGSASLWFWVSLCSPRACVCHPWIRRVQCPRMLYSSWVHFLLTVLILFGQEGISSPTACPLRTCDERHNLEQKTICFWAQLFDIIRDKVILCTDLSGKPCGHSQVLGRNSMLLVPNFPADCFLQVAVSFKPQAGSVNPWSGSHCTSTVLFNPTSRVSPRMRNSC